MLETTAIFNESFYLDNNSDVAQAVKTGTFKNAYEHFMQFGRFEARDPSEFFNTNFYLNNNPDVLVATQTKQITAFDHFIKNGQLEKRDPSPIFNTNIYLKRHPDVAQAVEKDILTGIEHFVKFGQKENRFPTSAYAKLNTLLVGNTRGDNVVQINSKTGQISDEFITPKSGGLVAPDTLIYGPDGNNDGIPDLYISSGDKPANSSEIGASAVLRYDSITGQFIDVFVGDKPNTNIDETGGLHRPYGMTFGPDGNLYVSSFLTDQILRYNGKTGQFIDIFASGNQQAGGLNGPNGLLFAPDGNLYVTTQGSIAKNGKPDFSAGLPSQILKYNLQTRQNSIFASPETPVGGAGFVSLLGLTISPKDGDLYVSDFANDIRRYNLKTGNLINVLSTNYSATSPSKNFTGSLTFTKNGDLFVTAFNNSEGANNQGTILRFNNPTAQFSTLVSPNNNLVRPIGITPFLG